jgi:hypothetical protein
MTSQEKEIISKMAYKRYELRIKYGFEGNDVSDWLESERLYNDEHRYRRFVGGATDEEFNGGS